MEGRAKVTKDVLCEEARFILANVLAEGRYGRQNRVADIRRICEGAVTIPFQEYVGFLEAAGYLVHDRQRDTLDVTPDGEKVVTGERVAELMERAVAHFKGSRKERERAAQQAAVARQSTTAPAAAITAVAAPGAGVVSGTVSSPVPTQVSSAPVSMTHAPSVVLGERDASARYERLATIGSGGVGTVYRARQLPLEREVALKEIRELFTMFGETERREIVRRFGEVARAAAQLSHPNIVTLHDVSMEREHPFVVSELMPGGSVRRLITDADELPVTLVMKYLLQVLHALRAAHAQGVLHRGIKPENLLVDGQGNVKVSDFGFARIVERDQVIRQVYVGMGAVAYMAPEMFTDPASAGPHADIYALGIVFYELLTRKVPGRRSPMPSQVSPGLPRGIDEIFDKMTRDDRADRYASVQQIFDDIEKLDGMKAFIQEHHVALFVDNPVAGLRLRAPTAPTTVTDVPVVPSVPAVPRDDDVSVVVDPAPPALGRRPYSVQQRQKNKSES